MTHNPSETMDAYVTRLKRLVQTCDYGTLADEMIRDQVFGKSQAGHDRSLDLTLQRLCDSGLNLNKDKCLFSIAELVYFGFKISAAGLSPDDKKVKAIRNAHAPTHAEKCKAFLVL